MINKASADTKKVILKMIDKALETIKKYHMISKGDTIAVCLSGGADSMALFHLLCCNKENFGIDLIALHINHGLRPESEDEEVFVKEYCKKQGVECLTLKAEMLTAEKPQGLSIEMWARKVRYDFFDEMSKKYSAKLAMAHTLSDRCETVIFNISRGAGIKGSIGIPPKRDNIIRPLIDCTRTQIEEYCSQNSIPYVTDASNFEDIYSRNKIRLRVIPTLLQINPAAEKSIGEFSQENAEIYTFLTQLSDNLYENSIGENGFDIGILKGADKVVIKAFLRNILERYNALSKDNILAILKGIFDGKLQKQLSAQVMCRVENGYLKFFDLAREQKNVEIEKIRAEIDKDISFLSKNYRISRISREEFEKSLKNDKNCLTYCLDYDRINNTLFFRTRKTGDEFSFIKRNVTKTIKKLLIEDKVPKKQRETLAILSNETDDALWVEGYGTSRQYAVTQQTRNILIIKQK